MGEICVIGGGLAGSEAAWQAARQGVRVRLVEMRPLRMTEAHTTSFLGELVCSNSLRSKELVTGPGLLKAELDMAGSLIMRAAASAEVAAGSALAVDRALFAEFITREIQGQPLIEVFREEVTSLPVNEVAILATGPLTSTSLAEALAALIGEGHLHFYDAIAPILDAEAIERERTYTRSRYGKGGDDYVNCPMDKDQYNRFYDSLIEADEVTARSFEEAKVFEGCMPIEVMARRGRDTLRFGPLRPVGLQDPRTGKMPYAVVQLRTENRQRTAYNMVGFQTRLRWPEQKRVFRLIPGLERAEFLRYGSMHRNTFVNSPGHLRADLVVKERETLYLAGQIAGVEGYIESTAMGLVAGINAARRVKGMPAVAPLANTAHGALIRHITESPVTGFQPSNIHHGLIPADEGTARIRDKKQRRLQIAAVALHNWSNYLKEVGIALER